MNLCLIHSTKLILFLVLVIHYRLSPENLRKRITVQNAIAKIHPLSPLSPPKPHSCSKLSLKWWRYIGTVFIIPPHHSAENDRLVIVGGYISVINGDILLLYLHQRKLKSYSF